MGSRGQSLLTNNPESEETAKFRLLEKARAQREFFQYSGSLQFESDWDFRVNNIVTSQEVRYLIRPKFFRNSKRRINGKVMLTPIIGAELGRNLKNPLTSEDRGISRLKAGGILTVTSDNPLGGSFGKELVWENPLLRGGCFSVKTRSIKTTMVIFFSRVSEESPSRISRVVLNSSLPTISDRYCLTSGVRSRLSTIKSIIN